MFLGITGKGVTVGILDDGIDHENPDLKENFVSGSFLFILLWILYSLACHTINAFEIASVNGRDVAPSTDAVSNTRDHQAALVLTNTLI